jgi:parallel beta-helix repeat protein
VIALVLLAGPAMATDYFVAPAGNDAATGRAGAPWKTLQKAADSVASGDVVTVEDGDYQGFLLEGKQLGPGRVVFRARNRWKARITTAPPGDQLHGGISILSSSQVTIDGFEVTRMPRAGIALTSAGPDVTGGDTRGNVVQNCWSHDNGAQEGEGGSDGIFTGYALDVVIENNLVENNAEHGIYVSNSADNPIIRNNTVRGNFAQGIQINADGDLPGDGIITNWEISGNEVAANSIRGGSTAINLDGAVNGRAFNNLLHGNGKGGFVLWRGNANSSSSGNLFFNNTVYNPAGSKAAFLLYTEAANNVIFNNIFYARAGGLVADEAGSGNQHDHNLVASVEDLEPAAGESMPDPLTLFAGVAAADFRLRAGSTAVDRGVATFAGKQASPLDREGRQRPAGAAFDIGCYELGGSPSPVDGGTPGTGGAPGAGGAPGNDAGSGDAGGADGPAMTSSDGGCGCGTGPGRSGGVWLLMALALLTARLTRSGRRDRRRHVGCRLTNR